MKKLTGLVVILAILILGGYYGMGMITEQTVKRNVDNINQSNSLFVDIVEYNRGWFTSHAMLNWRLHIPERMVKSGNGQSQMVPAQDYQSQMPLKIYHGPFIFANKGIKFGLGYAQTDFNLPEKYSEQFKTLFTPDSTQPKLDMSLLVSYLNSSKVSMAVPEFKLVAKEGNGKFDWMGMNSTMNVSSDMDKISGDVIIDGMTFSKDQVTGTMSEVSTDYDLHRTESGLYLGDASMSFPSLIIQNNNQKMFELDDFDLHSNSDIENGLFNSHFQTSLDKIVANGKTYGPGNLEMAVRNLDAAVLAHINEEMKRVQQGSDLEKQQAMIALMPEIPKLFSRGAEFEISEMTFTVPEGTIEGNMMISLPQGDNNNPFELMKKVQGNGRLKVPAAVLKQVLSQSNQQRLMSSPQSQPANSSMDVAGQSSSQADQQINAMVQSGMLVQQGTDYIIEMSLNQGQLMVNGKPFNPAMMKF